MQSLNDLHRAEKKLPQVQGFAMDRWTLHDHYSLTLFFMRVKNQLFSHSVTHTLRFRGSACKLGCWNPRGSQCNFTGSQPLLTDCTNVSAEGAMLFAPQKRRYKSHSGTAVQIYTIYSEPLCTVPIVLARWNIDSRTVSFCWYLFQCIWVKLYAWGWRTGRKFSASGPSLVRHIHMVVCNDLTTTIGN